MIVKLYVFVLCWCRTATTTFVKNDHHERKKINYGKNKENKKLGKIRSLFLI